MRFANHSVVIVKLGQTCACDRARSRKRPSIGRRGQKTKLTYEAIKSCTQIVCSRTRSREHDRYTAMRRPGGGKQEPGVLYMHAVQRTTRLKQNEEYSSPDAGAPPGGMVQPSHLMQRELQPWTRLAGPESGPEDLARRRR